MSNLSLPVRLAVGQYVLDMGTVSGADHTELSAELAELLRATADVLAQPAAEGVPA